MNRKKFGNYIVRFFLCWPLLIEFESFCFLNVAMGEESEVTSSSASGHHNHQRHSNSGISNSLHHTQIHPAELIIADLIPSDQNSRSDHDMENGGNGEVDLDLWDLDYNVNSVYNVDSGIAQTTCEPGTNSTIVTTAAKRTNVRNNSLPISTFSDSSSGMHACI